MNNWLFAVRALPMTFTIFVLQAWVSSIATLPMIGELVRVAPNGKTAIALAASLEQALQMAPVLRTSSQTFLLLSLSWIVLSPWLQMAWFSAIAQRESVAASLATGGQLYLRACLVSLWVVLGFVLIAAPIALASYGIFRFMAEHPNDRVRDLLTVGLLLPALPALSIAHFWHDLARARALHEPAFRATARSLRDAVRPQVLVQGLLLTGVGWAVVLASQLAEEHVSTQSNVVLIALLQSALLTRLVLRSRWLAEALTCAEGSRESRASESLT